MLKTVVLIKIFAGNCDDCFFNEKNSNYVTEIFSNKLQIFTLALLQCKASLLNKTIISLRKGTLDAHFPQVGFSVQLAEGGNMLICTCGRGLSNLTSYCSENQNGFDY